MMIDPGLDPRAALLVGFAFGCAATASAIGLWILAPYLVDMFRRRRDGVFFAPEPDLDGIADRPTRLVLPVASKSDMFRRDH